MTPAILVLNAGQARVKSSVFPVAAEELHRLFFAGSSRHWAQAPNRI